MPHLILETACRICLSEEDIMLNVFDKVEEFDQNIAEMLYCCGDIKINHMDIFSKLICDDCTKELFISAKFKEKCKKAEETLIMLSRECSDQNESLTSEDDKSDIKREIFVDESSEPISEFYEEIEYLVQGESDNNVEYILVQPNVELFVKKQNVKPFHLKQFIQTEEIDSEYLDEPDEENSIRTHTKSHDKKNKNHLSKINYNCDICGAGFTHLNNLKRHLNTHQSIEMKICSICTQIFSCPNKFDEHMSLHINSDESGETLAPSAIEYVEEIEEDPKKSHKCAYCKKGFASKSSLQSHIRIHTGDRPFECVICCKKFTTQGGLDLHARRHAGYKPYKCDFCERSFVESSNLKVHMRIHTGEKPHKCTVCGRNFSRVFLLQIHQRTHTGERPYECNVCKKAFAQQGDLASHKKIHTGERPHVCSICGKGFIKSSGLTQHMRKHSKINRFKTEYEVKNVDEFDDYINIDMNVEQSDSASLVERIEE